MEIKLSQRPSLALPRFHYPNPLTTLPYHRTKNSLKKHFRGLARRCRFYIEEMSRCQNCTKHYVVHAVKEVETLTSISKQYGMSIHSIKVANENILDASSLDDTQVASQGALSYVLQSCLSTKRFLLNFDKQEKSKSSNNILDGFSKSKPFIMLTTNHLPHAKFGGCFLVLVPLIAFCIKCIVIAFHTKFTRDLGCQVLNESKRHNDGLRSMRWKYALSDIREPDSFDSESRPDSNISSADEEKNSFEDVSHQYSKLEHDYQKFLSECGMSKQGYWRGGSLE